MLYGLWTYGQSMVYKCFDYGVWFMVVWLYGCMFYFYDIERLLHRKDEARRGAASRQRRTIWNAGGDEITAKKDDEHPEGNECSAKARCPEVCGDNHSAERRGEP